MKSPSLKLSLIGVLGILIILLTGIIVFKIDIIILLILSIIFIAIVAHFNGMHIGDIIDGMKEGCSQAFVGLLFFLLIGAIIGIWIQAGTVPALVYYGLKILNPKYFLISSFFICSIVSSVVGTSWGTIGTVGIAIIGVATGSGLNIPLGVVAGSIVSGAWFGDKMSPISDSTVLTATASHADVYSHIKAMCYTTIPSYLLTLVVFAIMNHFYSTGSTLNYQTISPIQELLEQQYHIGMSVFIPALLLVVLCILKVDAILSLLCVIGAGVVCSIVVQGNSLTNAFDAIMNGVHVQTALPSVNTLLNRGGINSMMSTFLLGFMALCLGGVLQKTGFLHVIISKITTRLKSTFSLVLTTMLTCVLGNAVFGDTYLTIVLNANMYSSIYEERGLDSSMLSRTIEEAATMSTPLIPWTAASAFIIGALGVSTLEYAGFAVLNIINPLLSLCFTALGIAIVKKKK